MVRLSACCFLQSLSHVRLFVTQWTAMWQAPLSFTISQSLLKPMSIESMMPSKYLILYRPLLLLFSIIASIRVFSKESVLRIRFPKYWSFSFSISTSNEYSGLIFIRIDWFDFLAVQGNLRSLLQYYSSRASVLWHSTFFVVQLSLLYMTTGKTIALTIQTFAGKVMSLLFNTLPRFFIAFLSRSKYLLISRLLSPSTVIFGVQEKSLTVSIVPHLFAMKWWDWMPWSQFSECWVLSQSFHSPLSLSSRGSLVAIAFLVTRSYISLEWWELRY